MNGLRVRAKAAACFALLLSLCTFASSSTRERYEKADGPVRRAQGGTQVAGSETNRPVDDILGYISSAWGDLTRSTLECKALADPKTEGEPILYLPAGMAVPKGVSDLGKQCNVRIEHLPAKITELGSLHQSIPEGLLYLANPYVVPGGQFNEMYGWDSYFIILGLLRQHRLEMAKGMVENFVFEIENYGGVLNANRTYYLSRSQPPFLSSMVLAVYDAEKDAGHADPQWLAKAYQYVVRDYAHWNRTPHLAGSTGLSRYFDVDGGPVPEIMADPSHYYRGVAQYFLIHGGVREKYLAPVGSASHSANQFSEPTYDVFVCDSPASQANAKDCGAAKVALSAGFYKGDRALRESGFDVTFRFGPFGADTHDYAPVCLNSLLFKTESDLERISMLLGHQEDASGWHQRALTRRKLIDRYFWDEKRGLYFDYDFVSGAQSSYEYATTFYPLWVGLASTRQAKMVESNLHLFEQPGGVVTSLHESEAQWDYPYGWAPLELLAAEGLRRYGYDADADRVAGKFLGTVLRNYLRDHTIREKYDVVKRSEDTRIDYGYAQNFTGFGWTNGVFLELLSGLSPEEKATLKGQ